MSETLNSGATEITAAQLFSTEEKPAVEAKPSAKTAETSEAQASEAEETENDSNSGEGEESKEENTDDDEPKEGKPKGVEKRISKLVRQRQELRREADYWKEQALKSQTGKAQEGHQAQSARQEDPAPKAEDFETYEDYQRALFRYEARQTLKPELDEIKKTLTGSKEEEAAEKATKVFEKRTKEFAKEHKDYVEALQSLEGVNVHKAVEQAILQSDHGPALLYELGKNPDVAEELADLPPHLQLKEIGKIEARIEARLEAKKNAPLKTTKAPAPPSPVGSKSEGKRTVDDPNLSPLDFFKLRNEEEKRLRNQYF